MFNPIAMRRILCAAALALVGVSALPGVSGATAREAAVCNARAQACMTSAEFRALTVRSVALNRKYGLGD